MNNLSKSSGLSNSSKTGKYSHIEYGALTKTLCCAHTSGAPVATYRIHKAKTFRSTSSSDFPTLQLNDVGSGGGDDGGIQTATKYQR